MGFCRKTNEEAGNDKKITRNMKKAKKKDKYIIKLLLLGAGESGKSTIFKQIKLIHNNGFSDDELRHFIPIVHNNIIVNMCELIKGAGKLGIDLSSVDADVAEVTSADKTGLISPELGDVIKKVFLAPPLQKAWHERTAFQVNDALLYYISRLDEVTMNEYMPTNQDVLHTRVRTSGISEMAFEIDSVPFRIFDVGGQRSERRKWIHCFENVTALIFVAAISEYDQTLFEDNRTNRLKEALTVFDDVCNSDYFLKTSMILFLNKRDLFEIKIRESSLKLHFPEYDGGADYDAALEFIKQQFMALNNHPKERLIYTHVTCATDTDNITFVFNSVKDIILNANIAGSGMM